MDKRMLGYIVAGIGLLIFFLSYPTIRDLAGTFWRIWWMVRFLAF